MPIFNQSDLIYAYTDADAVRDGVLIDLSAAGVTHQGRPINRVTAAVWTDLERAAERLNRPTLSRGTAGFDAAAADGPH